MFEYTETEEEKKERLAKLKALYEAENPEPRNRAERRAQAKKNKYRRNNL